MSNIIVLLVIAAIISVAIAKIVIEKKKGAKCIGCPTYQSSKNDCGGCNTSK